MKAFLLEPWPWYVGGPLIGLMVPLLLIMGNKKFGVSTSMKHVCASCLPSGSDFFRYDWKAHLWNLVFVAGILIGGVIGGYWLRNPNPVKISDQTTQALKSIGVEDFSTLIPLDIFRWEALTSLEGWLIMVLGGFLVGFGARYAGGCTSGHGIMGLSQFSKGSLTAVIGFFIGGLTVTHLILPLII